MDHIIDKSKYHPQKCQENEGEIEKLFKRKGDQRDLRLNTTCDLEMDYFVTKKIIMITGNIQIWSKSKDDSHAECQFPDFHGYSVVMKENVLVGSKYIPFGGDGASFLKEPREKVCACFKI